MSHFDQEHLQRLRLDVTLHAIDKTRASINKGAGDSFSVSLPRPMWDISAVLDAKVPSTIVCRSAGEAEGELLTWLLRIVRAERLACRQGRVVGWTQDQITRRPLSDSEVAEYKAQLKYIAERDRLAEQLAEALQRQKAQLATQAGVDHLSEMYGLASAKTVTPVAMKADPAHEETATVGATRRPSATRKGARHE
ncbi:hypothetical protein [Pseudomonas sp. AP-1]|uniref:hypothetical protein n=1 Tax=Pseudomonas sp. AP-1 TaxID=3231718 RepID=UPI0035B080A1